MVKIFLLMLLFAYFALNANCLSLGQTQASLDVLDPVLPFLRGLEFVLSLIPDAFFWAKPDAFDPDSLFLYAELFVGLVAALWDLHPRLVVATALYILSTDERLKKE